MKSVTGNLDVLILGQAGSAAWKYSNCQRRRSIWNLILRRKT